MPESEAGAEAGAEAEAEAGVEEVVVLWLESELRFDSDEIAVGRIPAPIETPCSRDRIWRSLAEVPPDLRTANPTFRPLQCMTQDGSRRRSPAEDLCMRCDGHRRC